MSQNVEMQTCPSCGELVPMEYVLCVWCGFDLTAEKIRRSGITIGNREAIDRMQRVVVDPNTAFREISLLPDLRGGKLILYAIGLMMTLNMITIFSKLDGLAYSEITPFTLVIRTTTVELSKKFLINIVLLIVQPLLFYFIFFVIWKISVRVLALFSKSFGGKGDSEKIRAAIGYSLLPVLFGWTLAWIIRLLTPSTTVNSQTYDGIQVALVAVSEEGFGFVGLLFIYISWIWSTILGIIAMKHVGRLSWVEAVIVAGIPYGLFMSIVL